MKQKTPPPPPGPPPPPPITTTARSVLKHHSDKSLHNPPPPTRLRASSKARESPKTPPEVVVNGVVPVVSSTRAKSVPPDLKNNSKARRGVVLNKPKPNEEVVVVGSQKGAEEAKVIVGRFVSRHGVEQFATRTRRRVGDSGLRRGEDEADGKKKNEKELQEKLEVSENLIKNLQAELLGLKAELDRVKGLNVELESKNKKLTEDLAAADVKMVAVGSSGKVRTLNFFGFVIFFCLIKYAMCLKALPIHCLFSFSFL